MIIIRTEQEINIMRQAGKILALILNALEKEVAPGVSTKALNDITNELCDKYEVVPVFLNYQPYGASRPYPASICISLNDEIVHGIPNEHPREIKEGDIVSLDMGIKYNGFIVDSAITVCAGEGDEKAKKLLEVTKRSLEIGIEAARTGNKTGDIGAAIQKYVKPFKFGIPEELGGHGVGAEVHEDPFIPNFGKPRQGVSIRNGMTFAIEPMITEGSKHIVLNKDGYTYHTADGSRAAHFEHTVAIIDGKAEILTKI